MFIYWLQLFDFIALPLINHGQAVNLRLLPLRTYTAIRIMEEQPSGSGDLPRQSVEGRATWHRVLCTGSQLTCSCTKASTNPPQLAE